MKTLLLTTLMFALAASTRAEVRKWTSADDASKTFEGEMVSAKGDSVTIKRKDGKVLTVPLAKLSQEDKDFVSKAGEEKAAAAKTSEAANAVKESLMGKALNGKTVILEGKSLKKHDVFAAKAPEYFLVYWGASWCGPCRQGAPELAALYKEKVSSATNVEFIHVSCDNDEASMKGFMKDMGFTFPAITRAKAAKIDRLEELSPKGIPNYKLLDSTGKVIAEGSDAKHKAEELAAGSATASAEKKS